jgi:hypothetical protein
MAPVARSAAGYVNPNWHGLVEALDDPTQREEAWAEFAMHIEALAGAVLARENAPVEAADLAQDVMPKLQDPSKLRVLRSTERPGG